MKIKFWGTRGSIPAAGQDTVKYGGNTTCLEIRLDGQEIIIIDAGTGIRKLGQNLLAELDQNPGNRITQINVLFTHFHWDHIQGFPFFRPFMNDKFKFIIYGHSDKALDMRQTLASQIRPPFLPFLFEHLKAPLEFNEIDNEPISIGKAKIYSIATNHPNSAIGYKIIERNRKFVFLTDNELYPPKEVTPYDAFVEFSDGADLLVHDSQWDDEEVKKYPTWGHSSHSQVIELALKANVKTIALFHHDPYHSDEFIDSLVKEAKTKLRKNKSKIKCFAAKEGMILTI